MRREDRRVTDPAAILSVIEAADSCRLGLVDGAGPSPIPYVVALNFGYAPAGADGLEGTFWFHCARAGKKLELIARNPQVCIQLDAEHEPVKNTLGCGWGMKYASVVAGGRARIIDNPIEARCGLECLMAHYLRLWGPPDGNDCAAPLLIEDGALQRTTVFRVDVEHLSAKRKS